MLTPLSIRPSCIALFLLLWLAAPARAEFLQQSAGVACRPATAADLAKLDYSAGAAANVFAAPGTPVQVAEVVCALPPTPPRHLMVRASVYLYDPSQRWTRSYCAFHNLFPTSPPVLAPLRPVSTNPRIASATLTVDPFNFVPHAVRCSVRPGQSLYGVETELVPL